MVSADIARLHFGKTVLDQIRELRRSGDAEELSETASVGNLLDRDLRRGGQRITAGHAIASHRTGARRTGHLRLRPAAPWPRLESLLPKSEQAARVGAVPAQALR